MKDKLTFMAWCAASVIFAELVGLRLESGILLAVLTGGMHIIDIIHAKQKP